MPLLHLEPEPEPGSAKLVPVPTKQSLTRKSFDCFPVVLAIALGWPFFIQVILMIRQVPVFNSLCIDIKCQVSLGGEKVSSKRKAPWSHSTLTTTILQHNYYQLTHYNNRKRGEAIGEIYHQHLFHSQLPNSFHHWKSKDNLYTSFSSHTLDHKKSLRSSSAHLSIFQINPIKELLRFKEKIKKSKV